MMTNPQSKGSVDREIRNVERIAQIVAAYYHELKRMKLPTDAAIELSACIQDTIIQSNQR